MAEELPPREMLLDSTTHPDFEAVKVAYLAAIRARDLAQRRITKAISEFQKSLETVQQREAELRAVYERVTKGGDDG